MHMGARLTAILLFAALTCPAADNPDAATIHVYRAKARLVGIVIRPSIYLDGREIDRLPAGAKLSFHAKPGKHMVTAGRSEVGQLIDFEAGKEYYFRLDHKNTAVTAVTNRQPMMLTPISAEDGPREMDGLKNAGGKSEGK